MHQLKEGILLLISFAMKNPLVNDFSMLSIEVPSLIKFFCLFYLYFFTGKWECTTVDPDVDVAQRRGLPLSARPRGTYLVTAGRANNLATPHKTFIITTHSSIGMHQSIMLASTQKYKKLW